MIGKTHYYIESWSWSLYSNRPGIEIVRLDSVIKISLIRQGTDLWRLYSIGSVTRSLRSTGGVFPETSLPFLETLLSRRIRVHLRPSAH